MLSNYPGSKTEVKDSERLTSLVNFGLLKLNFIPKKI